MIISHRYQTVFVHIPKNAGTSLRKLLMVHDPECFRVWGYRFLERHYRFGDSAHLTLVDLPPKRLNYVNKYTAFAVVRDPLSRFLSAVVQHFYQHKYRTAKSPAQFLQELDSIRIRYDPAYTHFCPQHFYTHIGKQQMVDKVFHMDDPCMDEQIIAFLSTKGFPVQQQSLEKVNQSLASKPELGDDFDMEYFYKLYKRDYELFGFEAPMEKRFEIDADAESGYEKPIDFSAYDNVRFLDWDFVRSRETEPKSED